MGPTIVFTDHFRDFRIDDTVLRFLNTLDSQIVQVSKHSGSCNPLGGKGDPVPAPEMDTGPRARAILTPGTLPNTPEDMISGHARPRVPTGDPW